MPPEATDPTQPAADPGLKPEPWGTGEDNDVIHIPDARPGGDEPTVVDDDAAPGKEGGEGGEAGKETEQRFVSIGGIRFPVNEKGEVDPEAISKAYVPMGDFHRGMQEARRRPMHEPGRTPGGGADPSTKSAPAAPEPFKRAENPHDPDENTGAWLKHEREQDRAETAYYRDLDQKRSEEWQKQVLDSVREVRTETSQDRIRQTFNNEFDQAATKLGVVGADTKHGKELRRLLWHMVAEDPRHAYNPDPDPESGQDRRDPDSVKNTEQLMAPIWETFKSWLNAELLARGNKATKLAAENGSVSPHKGGSTSVPGRTTPADGGGDRPKISDKRKGETDADAIIRDVVEGGVRAPR